MKQLFYSYVIALLVSISLNVSAQKVGELWGVCEQSNYGLGTIFSTDSSGSKSMSHFEFANGGYQTDFVKLVQATNGKLYGVTVYGGTEDDGVLFEFDPATGIHTEKYHFTGTGGAEPTGSLIQGSNLKLYGMTSSGGTDNLGVIFEYDISTGIMVKKLDFDGSNGANPLGALLQAGNGKLYGMTQWGGNLGYGVFFEYDINSNSITQKIDFNDTIGAYPKGSLIQALNGKLYGLTYLGGNNSYGVLFEYDLTSKAITKKVDFDTSTGNYPRGTLFQASNGNLYGTTYEGGTNYQGAIFEYNISANTLTKKVDLIDTTGSYPYGDFIQASNGKLYGMTSYGGTYYYGTLIEFDITSGNITRKIDFDRPFGISPRGSLLKASNGKLYGVTYQGGTIDGGTLFEFDIASFSLTTKVNLGYGPNGTIPVGPLLKAASGKLYGLTTYGGSKGMGVLYEFDTSSYTFTKKADFNGINGANPEAALIQASNGKLYGVAKYGGTNNKGVLFVYDITANTLTKKFDFDSINGSNPRGALIQAKNGKLYGMTKYGGPNDYGVLFEYNINTNVLTKKVDFDGSNGTFPSEALMQSSNGKLYGLTFNGGYYDYGVLFEYDIYTDILDNKVDFDGPKGANPLGSLIEAKNGKLYGLTYYGGLNDMGVLFDYDTTSKKLTKRVDFFGSNGSYPDGSVLEAGNGLLYGFTYNGGDYGQGVFFEYNIQGNLLNKKSDFLESYEGGNPTGSFVEIAGSSLPNMGKAEICMVTVDSATGKNLVVWERPQTTAIKYYNIYKESWQAGIYTKIGHLPYKQLSIFVDTSSNPRKKSDIYCITSEDSLGNESSKSKIHKTIHLTANKGVNNEINLIWNHYEGYLYRSYYIYRGTSPTNLVLLDSISSNFSSFSDIVPPSGLVFYQVSSVKQDPCYPAIFRAQSGSGPYSQSVSNIKDYNTIAGPYLTTSTNNISVSAADGSYNFIYIYTNLPVWNATSDKSWLTLVKDSSKTNANIKIIAQKNASGSSRVATVIVTGSGVPDQNVVVTQDGTTTGILVEKQYGKLTVYPNPSTGLINIDYYLPKQSTVQLSLYDMMGKLVKQTINQNQLPGNYHSELNLNDYSSQNGIYYVRLTYDNNVYNSKVIISK
jgi:uncharacterized repeat protein (TIGR03803 family)